MRRQRFLTSCTVLVVALVVGAIVSIAAGWPAQLGGQGDPSEGCHQPALSSFASSVPFRCA